MSAGNWEEGTIPGYWYQAQVFETGSKFGIDGGRVSKLTIRRIEDTTWVGEEVYNYSRGLDFDRCPPEVLSQVLEKLQGSAER